MIIKDSTSEYLKGRCIDCNIIYLYSILLMYSEPFIDTSKLDSKFKQDHIKVINNMKKVKDIKTIEKVIKNKIKSLNQSAVLNTANK